MNKLFKNIKLGSLILLLLTIFWAISCKKDKEITGNQGAVQIISYYPNSGNNGTLVTIEGENFDPNLKSYKASIGEVAAEVISVSNNRVVLRVPSNGKNGNLKLWVNQKEFSIGAYTYQDLTISKIFPSNGPAGSQIRISGAGFGSIKDPAKVSINSKDALVVSASDTLLVVEVPDKAGLGPVVVLVNGKESKGQNFNYQEIAGIKPISGGKGTKVMISGIGFDQIKTGNLVDFNGKSALVLESTPDHLLVEAPVGLTTGPISVTINQQKITGPIFTVRPLPLIRSVAPLSGPEGTEVTIEGEYYSANLEEVLVSFNGKKAQVVRASEKSIIVKVPASAGQGKLQLAVNDQLTIGPEFKEQNLGIIKVLPDNGLEGDIVRISGVGFSKILPENRVFFNGVLAPIQSASDTELQVIVPAGVSTGDIRVEVGSLMAKGPVFSHAGVVTIAGGPSSSIFGGALAIAVDSKNNVFVSDGNLIRKISLNGSVSVFVGSTDPGAIDGIGEQARFNYINGITFDQNDVMYVSDAFNKRIRKVSNTGQVSTIANNLPYNPAAIGSDFVGNIYVGQPYNGLNLMNKISGGMTKLVPNMYETAEFIAAVNATEVYYAQGYIDYLNVFSVINGSKSTFAGTGEWGIKDGPILNATFQGISGMAIGSDKTIYLIDGFGTTLRKIENGIISTLFGQRNGNADRGFEDGSFANAKMNQAKNICVGKDGVIYVVDSGNKAIRKIVLK